MLGLMAEPDHAQPLEVTGRAGRCSRLHGTLKAGLVDHGELSGRSFATLGDSGT